jgi:hypothetical protein
VSPYLDRRPLLPAPLTLADRPDVVCEVAAAYTAGCSLTEIADVLVVDGRHLALSTVRALLVESGARPRPVGGHPRELYTADVRTERAA